MSGRNTDTSGFREPRDKIALTTPAGSTCEFTVAISTSAETRDASDFGYTFDITGSIPGISELQTRSYRVLKREHNEYLDMLAAVARDFQTRVPINRRAHPTPTFQADFSELVTTNLCPRILYGYGDPGVLRVKGADIGDENDWYYVVSTSNDAPDSFPIIRSRDFIHWETRGFIFPRGQQPSWASVGDNLADYWAAELHEVHGEFRAYFVARHRESSELCIGLARACSPDGPYTAHSEPLLRGNRIDPHVFLESEHEAYLYWKEDSNGLWPDLLNDCLFRFPQLINSLFSNDEDRRTACLTTTLWPWTQSRKPMERFFVQHTLIEAVISNFKLFEEKARALCWGRTDNSYGTHLETVVESLRTPVYAQRLGEDGISLEGPITRVLENDQTWEAHVVEGVWVLRYEARYYMFYAGGDFSTPYYGIGVAVADSPIGPFKKQPGPFLSSTTRWFAPGHPSALIGPGGEPILLLHAFAPGTAGYKRFRALLGIGLELRDGVLVTKAFP